MGARKPHVAGQKPKTAPVGSESMVPVPALAFVLLRSLSLALALPGQPGHTGVVSPEEDLSIRLWKKKVSKPVE